ncbi:CehA/McbA family metallohydrolase, partial [Myxococcota bacterium]
ELVDVKPSGAEDPDYDVILRSRTGARFGTAVIVDKRAGIQAAPDLACAPGGGVLLAYHTSHAHSLVKWWTIRRVKDGKIEELAAKDPSDVKEPKGEVQGAEFPALAVMQDRLAVVTRPSQGAYLQTVDAAGISPVRKLNRHEWGARGMRMTAAPAPDGSLLVVRRARDQSVLERITFEKAGAGFPVFRKVKDEKQVTLAESSEAPVPDNARVWPDTRVYFGDIHMHSAATDGTGPPDEIYARAWVRGHDFAALTDHDVLVGRRLFPSLQDEIAWLTDIFNAKEGFSTLHAYEWTTPALPKGSGHRNVYFRSHAPRLICGYKDRCPDTRRLNQALKKERAVAVPHHTSWTGTDWQNAEPKIQRLFEMVSVHGANEHPGEQTIKSRSRMEGMYAVDGLQTGLKFGFVGGSDAHGLLWHHGIGRKRDPWSCGLTGILAKGNSRKDLFDAMHARRTFATSGEKLWVLLRIGEVLLGGEVKLRSPVEVHYGVFTTRPLAYFEIVRDTEVVFRAEPGGDVAGGKFKDENVPPGPHVYYLRAVQGDKAGEVDMAWTSPVFVTVLEGK